MRQKYIDFITRKCHEANEKLKKPTVGCLLYDDEEDPEKSRAGEVDIIVYNNETGYYSVSLVEQSDETIKRIAEQLGFNS